jgi:hypothetical protein
VKLQRRKSQTFDYNLCSHLDAFTMVAAGEDEDGALFVEARRSDHTRYELSSGDDTWIIASESREYRGGFFIAARGGNDESAS